MLISFIPPTFDDVEQTRQAQLLHYLLLFAALVTAVGSIVLMLAQSRVSWILNGVIIVLFASQIAGLYLIRQGYIKSISIGFTTLFWGVFTVLAVTNSHVTPLYVLGYNLVVLMAGLLLGWRWLIFFVGISFMSAFIINQLHIQNLLLQTNQTRPSNVAITMQFISFIWTAICIYFVVNSLQIALRNLQRREKVLAQTMADLRSSNQQLRESEARYRDLFDNATDLIQGFGLDGRFQYANQRWHDVMGYSEAELPHLHFLDTVRPDQRAHCQTIFAQLAEGYHFNQVDVVFMTKMGQEIIVEGNLNAQVENGRFVGTRGIFRDVTSRRAAEQTLHQRNLTLETLNKLSQSVALTLEIGLLLNTIIEFFVHALDCTSGYIGKWDPQTKIAGTIAEYYSPHAHERERVSDLGTTYNPRRFW